MAVPDRFFFDDKLECLDGEHISWVAELSPSDDLSPELPGFRRIFKRPLTWLPNSDDFVTLVNFMRVTMIKEIYVPPAQEAAR